MTELLSKEELQQCRRRVNQSKDETQLYSKAGVCDDYTAGEVKLRKNELDFEEELKRINKEFENY